MEYSGIIKKLLDNRGITEEKDIEEFFSPLPQKTYDPFLLSGMEEGVELILKNVYAGKRICIYGDYDADGMTSISILYTVISELTDNLFYYIPSRFDEGYGLNKKAIDVIREKDTDMIITVDCGTVSYDEVEYAKRSGMDIVVTDHHHIDDRKADCILINPKQEECGYPFKDLAGCGVAYKLAQAIQQKAGLPRSLIIDILDIVAIGTVGDIVPLVDENRTLVKYGIEILNRRERPGVSLLSEKISLDRHIGSDQIAYGIVPHLNAAGRMSRADAGVQLLMAKTGEEAAPVADKLIEYNNERKSVQNRIYEECMAIWERENKEDLFPIIKSEKAHEGIVGIVAGKIKEQIGRPVSIVTPAAEGYLKGTGRSIRSVDIYEVMKTQSGLFEKFGGHKGACGYMMKRENLEDLRRGVNREMEKLLDEDPDIFTDETSAEMYIEPGEADLELALDIEKMEPFGNGNPRPVFGLKDVFIGNVQFMGKDGNHVRFMAGKDGSSMDCILFQRAKEFSDELETRGSVEMLGEFSVNRWKGNENIQFIVDDIKA